jgi:hypothetical protein
MTPQEAKASYRRFLAQYETVTVRRYSGTGTNRSFVEAANCRARVIGARGNDPVLAGTVTQANQKVIVYADDIANGLTLPVTDNDKLVISGKEHAIKAVDDVSRRINGVLIAYEFMVRG